MCLRFVSPASLVATAQLIAFSIVSWHSTQTCTGADTLPRRISLGTQVQPVSEATQQKLKLKNTRGVEVISVMPDSTAAACGIQSGDVLLALGEQTITNVPTFVETVASIRVGKEVEIRLNRDGQEKKITAAPKGLPLETNPLFDIEYDSVSIETGRLRTVLTLPKNASNVPAVLLLSGLGNGPAEHPMADPIGMKTVAYSLAQNGFAVMRVDKPGCGDSEGGTSRDADFKSIVDGYIAGLKKLKQDSRINPKQTILFGFSMGGVQAPLVAATEPVAGIAIYGAMSCNWQEYLQSTTRRQLALSGAKYGDIEQAVAQQSAGWHYLIYEGKSPDDIATEHTELMDWVDKTWADRKNFSGIHYRFFQQLGKSNVASAWDKFDGKVLSLWGEHDVVTSKEDHELIAEIANKKNENKGSFIAIPGVDHNLRPFPPQSNEKPGTQTAPPALVEAFVEWSKSI